jgi:hypothetical protein
VYLRISTPAAIYGNRYFQKLSKRSFQNLLHIQRPRMFLPAAVIGTMITYMKKVTQGDEFYREQN